MTAGSLNVSKNPQNHGYSSCNEGPIGLPMVLATCPMRPSSKQKSPIHVMINWGGGIHSWKL